MRKTVVGLMFVFLAALLNPGKVCASGDTVNLSTPTTGTVTFSEVNGISLVDFTISGSLVGTAMGTGALNGTTAYSLSGDLFLVAANLADVNYGTVPDFPDSLSLTLNNGSLLTGTISGIHGEQTGKIFIMTGDLTVSSGSITSTGLTLGNVVLVFDLPTAISLPLLTTPETGILSYGQDVSSVTPEPGTMILFGSGILMLCGIVCSKRNGIAEQDAD
jgi:hypothetical protein